MHNKSACQEYFMKNDTFLSVFWVSIMLWNFEEKKNILGGIFDWEGIFGLALHIGVCQSVEYNQTIFFLGLTATASLPDFNFDM